MGAKTQYVTGNLFVSTVTAKYIFFFYGRRNKHCWLTGEFTTRQPSIWRVWRQSLIKCQQRRHQFGCLSRGFDHYCKLQSISNWYLIVSIQYLSNNAIKWHSVLSITLYLFVLDICCPARLAIRTLGWLDHSLYCRLSNHCLLALCLLPKSARLKNEAHFPDTLCGSGECKWLMNYRWTLTQINLPDVPGLYGSYLKVESIRRSWEHAGSAVVGPQ